MLCSELAAPLTHSQTITPGAINPIAGRPLQSRHTPISANALRQLKGAIANHSSTINKTHLAGRDRGHAFRSTDDT